MHTLVLKDVHNMGIDRMHGIKTDFRRIGVWFGLITAPWALIALGLAIVHWI